MIRQYIEREKIFDMIDSIVQDSFVDGIYNPFLVDTLFHARFTLLICDIIPSEEEAQDCFKMYDRIMTKEQDLITQIIEHPLYESTKTQLEAVITAYESKQASFARAFEVLQETVSEMQKQTETLQEDINGFDFDKVKEVVGFKEAIMSEN